MGIFDEELKGAAEETDKELEGEIKELLDLDVEKLFPAEADRKAVNELMAKMQKVTDRNKRAQAFKEFTVLASAAAVETIKGSAKLAKKLLV